MRNKGQQEAWLGRPFLAPGHFDSPSLATPRGGQDRAHRGSEVSHVDFCLRAPAIFLSRGQQFESVCMCVCARVCTGTQV